MDGAETARVGFIGLGKMGRPMALNLLRVGFPLLVHNRSRGVVQELVARGAVAAGSSEEISAGSAIVLTCLPDSAAVEEVYLSAEGLVESSRAGQIFVDTSTVGLGTSRTVAAALASRGARFLDAPVSGGVDGAEAATLTIMVGGDPETFERARPVLMAMGQRLHHVGPTGSGTVVKLANQLLVGINVAGVAEAMVLGVKAGADPGAMLDVLSTSYGGSRMLERVVPLMLERRFDGRTPIDLIRKDLGLIADLAAELGVPIAEGEAARRVFDAASAANLGTHDMAAVVLPLEGKVGVEVVTPPREGAALPSPTKSTTPGR
ncbi:MAG: NAD(P)-dependent oxidoreductase [Chloroflexota bacterium]|nr:NAD(P)-dependent oxidoreductase [Chloroflexota bacterium]